MSGRIPVAWACFHLPWPRMVEQYRGLLPRLIRRQEQSVLKRNCSYEIMPEDRYYVSGLREELDAER